LLGPETYSLTAFREAETIVVPNAAEMDVAIEGSTSWWPNEKNEAVLPEFDRFNRQRYYIEVFNRSRNRSAMTLAPLFPALEKLDSSSPRLEYELHLHSKGKVTVKALLSPMLNFYDDQGLRYAISFDDELVQFINLHEGRTFQDWEESVSNNITLGTSQHTIAAPGSHVLKFWAIDPGVILQRLVIETGEVPPCYLGPSESYRQTMKSNRH